MIERLEFYYFDNSFNGNNSVKIIQLLYIVNNDENVEGIEGERIDYKFQKVSYFPTEVEFIKMSYQDKMNFLLKSKVDAK